MAPCRPLYCQWGCCTLPQRVTLAIFLHLALQNAFNNRQVLHLAIVAMVATDTNNTVDSCPMYEDEEITEIEGGQFQWDRRQNSLLLYVFFVGCILTQVPGGLLADKYGGKHVLGTALFLSSVITLIFPVALISMGFWAAIVLRLLLGFVQGPVFPALSSMMSTWIPPDDRPFLGSISYSGSTAGIVLGNVVSGFIIERTNSWPNAFYFWGVVSIIWYFLYLLYAFSTPQTHPFLTQKEREYLDHHVEDKVHFDVPWVKILTNVPFWANVSGNFAHNYIFFTITVYLPTYMKEILKLNISNNAVFSSVPVIFMWMGAFMWGGLATFLKSYGLLSTLALRKIYGAGGNILSAALVLMAVYMECNRTIVIILYVLSLVVNATYYSSLAVNANDLSKHFGGTLFSIVNALGITAGIIGPMIVGELTKDASIAGWKMVFWIMLAVTVATSLVFLFFGSAERQEFDMIELVI